MYSILKFEGDKVVIGSKDNRVFRYETDCINYKDAKEGDIVEVYGDPDCIVILKSVNA